MRRCWVDHSLIEHIGSAQAIALPLGTHSKAHARQRKSHQ